MGDGTADAEVLWGSGGSGGDLAALMAASGPLSFFVGRAGVPSPWTGVGAAHASPLVAIKNNKPSSTHSLARIPSCAGTMRSLNNNTGPR